MVIHNVREEGNMKILRYVYEPLVCLIILFLLTHAHAQDQIPVAAPMTTDLAGSTAAVALPSVLRVVIPSKNSTGTAFLHKSGVLLTAAHVVKDAAPSDILLLDAKAQRHSITNVMIDEDMDIAILFPHQSIAAPAMELTSESQFKVGMQVSTWGYPGGYNGLPPLLMSGYLAGVDVVKTDSGKRVVRWVVNAAFNNGNSGGPLVDIEKGKIIGLVSSKLAPLPKDIESALAALKNQKFGFRFARSDTGGKSENLSEAQVVELVLQHLRSQTQLVIGYAVTIGDLKTFLKSKGIDP